MAVLNEEQALVTCAVHSCAIGGREVDGHGLHGIVFGGMEPASLEEQEALGMFEAMQDLLVRHASMDVSAQTILALHRIMEGHARPSQAGRFRRRPNSLVRDWPGREGMARVEILEPEEVPEAMESLCQTWNRVFARSDVDVVMLAGFAVVDFLCIAPFARRNGRISRLLAMLLLCKAGHAPLVAALTGSVLRGIQSIYADVLALTCACWRQGLGVPMLFAGAQLQVLADACQAYSGLREMLDGRLAPSAEGFKDALGCMGKAGRALAYALLKRGGASRRQTRSAPARIWTGRPCWRRSRSLRGMASSCVTAPAGGRPGNVRGARAGYASRRPRRKADLAPCGPSGTLLAAEGGSAFVAASGLADALQGGPQGGWRRSGRWRGFAGACMAASAPWLREAQARPSSRNGSQGERCVMKMMCKLLPALLACMLLGSVQTAGAGDNPVEDIASLKAKAKAGDAEAQCALADRYMSGQGLRQDYAKGVEWYRKAAAQGSAEAQHWLGVISYEGTGVKQDYAKALEWFRKAADQGHPSAQGWLAGMYSEGKGVAQDKSQAKEWYRKAYSSGDAYCCKESERLEKEGF